MLCDRKQSSRFIVQGVIGGLSKGMFCCVLEESPVGELDGSHYPVYSCCSCVWGPGTLHGQASEPRSRLTSHRCHHRRWQEEPGALGASLLQSCSFYFEQLSNLSVSVLAAPAVGQATIISRLHCHKALSSLPGFLPPSPWKHALILQLEKSF